MNTAQKLAQLNREAILSASPATLLTMLYDRLLVDLNRARQAQQNGDWQRSSENLVHAQAIITELDASLIDGQWDGSQGLRSLYAFLAQLLIDANIKRDAQQVAQAINLLEPLRTAWHEAAAAPAGSTERTIGEHLG
ncbi:flagellar export chaperone FliS [Glutamicibacter sp. 0426]|uniref:flagellar export chaperone FliS n=1 Tax=Glutamicibacter sp. 0426 TaxID=1913445 RepID=UPI0009389FB2|nr:flagellar export chaperone FliS [Glutamicibacter sp. 0426]